MHTEAREKSNKCCLWARVDFRWASLLAQMVNNLPVMGSIPGLGSIWVQSLGWEDPLEEGMAVNSSILAWRIPTDRAARWATVLGGHKKLDTTQWLSIAQHRF